MHLRLLSPYEDPKDPLFQSEECQQLLKMMSELYEQKGFNLPWASFVIVDEDQVKGTCSFMGVPENGEIEIAYWTFPAFEGHGIASFACQSLVEIARKQAPEITLTAKTSPGKNASTQILQKNGFAYHSVVQDHEIGDAWLWKLTPFTNRN